MSGDGPKRQDDLESQSGESFLNRWSRRKSGESDQAEAPMTGQPSGEESEAENAFEGLSEEEIAARLPDIEGLDAESDYAPFLQVGVPEALRQRALRKLWRLNPIVAAVDGLNDYDDDFTKEGMVAGALKTAYKVGKGYLTDEDRAPKEKTESVEEVAEAEATAPEDSTADDEPGEAEAAQESPEEEVLAEAPEAPSTAVQEDKEKRPSERSALARRWGSDSVPTG